MAMALHILRTTTTLHQPLVLWHIAAKPLLFICIPVPGLLEWVEIELHDLRQNIAFVLLLDAVDEFI